MKFVIFSICIMIFMMSGGVINATPLPTLGIPAAEIKSGPVSEKQAKHIVITCSSERPSLHCHVLATLPAYVTADIALSHDEDGEHNCSIFVVQQNQPHLGHVHSPFKANSLRQGASVAPQADSYSAYALSFLNSVHLPSESKTCDRLESIAIRAHAFAVPPVAGHSQRRSHHMLLLPSAGERDCDDGSSNTSTVRMTSVLYLHGSRKFPRKCLDWTWQPSAHQFPEPCIGSSIAATGPDVLSLPSAARSMSLSVLPAHRLFYVTAGIQTKIKILRTLPPGHCKSVKACRPIIIRQLLHRKLLPRSMLVNSSLCQFRHPCLMCRWLDHVQKLSSSN